MPVVLNKLNTIQLITIIRLGAHPNPLAHPANVLCNSLVPLGDGNGPSLLEYLISSFQLVCS